MTPAGPDPRAVPAEVAGFCRAPGITRPEGHHRLAAPQDDDSDGSLVPVASFETGRTPGLSGLGESEDRHSDLRGRRIPLVSRDGIERNPLPFRPTAAPGAPEGRP